MEGVARSGVFRVAVALLLWASPSACMHITGQWSSVRFADQVARFGFDGKESSRFYGNVTKLNEKEILAHQITLLFVDSQSYNKQSALYKAVRERNAETENCTEIMEPFRLKARMPLSECTVGNASEDVIRYVPCHEETTCPTQPISVELVNGSQFSFVVPKLPSPADWFVILIACSLGTNYTNWRPCNWEPVPPLYPISVKYDFWLVNGDPATNERDYFTYQFSFEDQGLLQVLTAFLCLFSILAFIQVCQQASKNAQRHTLINLFSACLAATWISAVLEYAHYMVYGQNGKGVPGILTVADLFSAAAQSMLMLLLLLMAKGWTITTMILTRKRLLFVVWGIYTALYLVLVIVVAVQIDEFSGKIAYQTVPGGFILALRCLILIWFLYELRVSYLQENVPEKLAFYRVFCLFYSLWFIYLPITTGVVSAIDNRYKFKAIQGTLLSVNFLSLAGMAWLLWPSRSKAYFKLTNHALDQRKLVDTMDYDKI
eukprot:m.7035 g.7035  ORF g.7035 m.7035 type:complete len:489 (+) comp17539_c0_seq2:111-1577(+)